MSFNRLALFVLMLSTPAVIALASSTTCPMAIGQHRLINVNVFEGPPVELATVIPIEGEWKLDYAPGTHYQFYLGCQYENVAELHAVAVPTSATLCRIQLSPRTHMLMNVVCE